MQLYMGVETLDMRSAFAYVTLAAVPRDYSDNGLATAPAYLDVKGCEAING